jgi:hypothetical protein
MEPTTLQKIEFLISSLVKKESVEDKRLKLEEMIKKPILTNSDFAILFSISKRSCRRWRKKENIPFIRISGRVYYLWTAVLPVLESKQICN